MLPLTLFMKQSWAFAKARDARGITLTGTAQDLTDFESRVFPCFLGLFKSLQPISCFIGADEAASLNATKSNWFDFAQIEYFVLAIGELANNTEAVGKRCCCFKGFEDRTGRSDSLRDLIIAFPLQLHVQLQLLVSSAWRQPLRRWIVLYCALACLRRLWSP